jgi:CRISPR/Cas system-associated exonuclease Cas4 (RecB family)
MIDFNKLIDKHLEREHKAKVIGRYYPSEIAGCMRKTWFSYKIPKKNDVKITRIFEAGNMLHEFITDVIKSEKNPEVELIRSELPIQIEGRGFIVSGRIDNLVLVKIDNKMALVEVKSTKFLPKEYKKEHEVQLQLYMQALGVHEGIILYIQKDNLETKAFPIKFKKAEAEKILKRFEELDKALKQDKIPEAEAKHDKDKGWMCGYCSYVGECQKS